MGRRVQGHDTGAAAAPASRPEQAPPPRPITQAIAGAAGGAGTLVVLESAAGSDLLGDVAGDARAHGLDVLHARPRGSGSCEPFTVARDLFAPAVAALDADDREAVLGGAPRLAEPLLRTGGSTAPAADDVAGEVATIHGFYWLAANLADRQPLAVLVEDAHRADRQSLRLCAYLAQRIEELPVALLLSAAPGWSIGSAALSA